ncbi:MAG: 50S ribosomal protein L44e [Candidatus Asgardarchaeia archaeon]
MKIVKEIRTYCPRCKTHTVHTVSLYKKGKDSALRAGARRYNRKKKGYGGQPKPIQRKTAKVTKKQTLRLKCKNCGYVIMKEGIRLKKLEIVR